MRRQPTLAEILSDDTGKIREEVADLLMEPNVQRLRPAQQVRPPARTQRRPFGIGWIVFGLVILVIVFIIRSLNSSKANYIVPTTIVATESGAKFPEAPPVEVKTVRTGLVIGNKVSIRTQPNLQGEIIREVNRNEILNVISFRDGWYEVTLFDQSSGYVFGAYLIPQNFNLYPYRVVIANNRDKLLVKEEGYPSQYRVILPDGQTSWIRKEDVAIYQ